MNLNSYGGRTSVTALKQHKHRSRFTRPENWHGHEQLEQLQRYPVAGFGSLCMRLHDEYLRLHEQSGRRCGQRSCCPLHSDQQRGRHCDGHPNRAFARAGEHPAVQHGVWGYPGRCFPPACSGGVSGFQQRKSVLLSVRNAVYNSQVFDASRLRRHGPGVCDVLGPTQGHRRPSPLSRRRLKEKDDRGDSNSLGRVVC